MSKRGPVDREKLYEEIARDVGLLPEEVKEIVRHQFNFVRKVMSRGNYSGVRLPRFGIFEVDENRLKNLREHYNGRGKNRE